ncbi:PBSX family phage terminase large subunit [Lactobacillus sp. 3B(2020)]|uniref:PBSX family phage terminase large subunit n=1 Tax=Lactobacillus sp. 3B(2020) TaxID=2695882 RepID=UPI0015DEB7AA|nr:PBSX family phage terminase large subunit [Lactobacillus sp. 3B(2020)]QLL69589.1 PBSX family phage terminase large subunit [Lactobacillus sp. 3B(2020)]
MTEQKNSLNSLVGGGYYDFWHDKHFYRVVKGSRASKKSKTTALNLIYRLMKYPWANILVIRRYSNTNRQSTYADLCWAIHHYGADSLFKCNPSMPEIIYLPTGQRIIFRGLDKALKLTSITVTQGYLAWVWVEEAYEIESADKLETIQESIRGRIDAPDAFKQITITFNPWNGRHWLKRTFFDPETRKDDVFSKTTTFRCNEWLDDKDRKRYLDLYRTNPRRARVAADGDWGVSEGLVFENNVEQIEFDPMAKITECGATAFGLDYGFGSDPTAFVAMAVDKQHREIWIYDEMYAYHQTTPETANWLKENGYQRAIIYADSASPERTQQLVDLGISNAMSVSKTPIEAGIDQLWQYKIHVHPKCENVWNEFNNYVFDSDSIGNTLNRPKDENNHEMDAIRYAMRQYMDAYDGSVGVDWNDQYHIAQEMGVEI